MTKSHRALQSIPSEILLHPKRHLQVFDMIAIWNKKLFINAQNVGCITKTKKRQSNAKNSVRPIMLVALKLL